MAQELLDAARVFREALTRFEPELVSGEDCAQVVEALARTENACGAARAMAARRAAACGAHRAKGFSDAGAWLARTTGSSVGQAKAAIDTAGALQDCPDTKEALVAGEVSLAQAGVIAGTEPTAPGSEAELLALARAVDLGQLKDRARKRRLEAIDPEDLHRRQHQARSVRHWRDEMGMVRLHAALPPEVGLGLVARLDAETKRLATTARSEGKSEPWAAHGADALVALCSGEGRGRPRFAEVVVVCDLSAYRRGHVHAGESCHLVGGGPVPVSVARAMAEDGFIKAVLHDGVRIDTVAHFGRHIKAELRTALELGPVPDFDGLECADGCGRRYGLQWDHVDPLANHGATSYDNLRPRCVPCHWEKTAVDRRAGLLNGPAPP